MIVSFGDKGTADIYDGVSSKEARRTLPNALWPIAHRKLDMLDAAQSLLDLKAPPSNHLEALKRELDGWHSVRVNKQYRIVFQWSESGAHDVTIADYH